LRTSKVLVVRLPRASMVAITLPVIVTNCTLSSQPQDRR
jgi:hypothetical protein